MKEYIIRVDSEMQLKNIAQKYGIGKDKILKDNHIREDDIEEGVRLYICVPDGERHIVKPLESIKSIARDYGINEEEIRRNNDCQEVFIGQTIYVPIINNR